MVRRLILSPAASLATLPRDETDGADPMTTRRAACSCGQLHLTIEGGARAHLHVRLLRVPAAHRRRAQQPGALCPRADHLVRHGDGVDTYGASGNGLTPLLSGVRLHCVLDGRRFSRLRRRRHRRVRRPDLPGAGDRGVGGVSPPMGEPAARHAAQARDEAGVMTFPRLAAQSTRVRIVQLVDARGDPAFVAAHWIF